MSQRKSLTKGKKDEQILDIATTVEPELVDGRGKFMYPDDSCYEGDYQLNVADGMKRKHGTGIITWRRDPTESYNGLWFDDKMNGFGIYTFASGAKYEGNMKDNNFDGDGEYTMRDGSKYRGEWQQNKMHGSGEYTDPTGLVWKGKFFNGLYDSGETQMSSRPSESLKIKLADLF